MGDAVKGYRKIFYKHSEEVIGKIEAKKWRSGILLSYLGT
jgi:hypothetical protein